VRFGGRKRDITDYGLGRNPRATRAVIDLGAININGEAARRAGADLDKSVMSHRFAVQSCPRFDVQFRASVPAYLSYTCGMTHHRHHADRASEQPAPAIEPHGAVPADPRVHTPARAYKAVSVGAGASGAMAIGAFAVGALAVGAVAIGALAIGHLAIKRLSVRKSKFDRLEIDELAVRRLQVEEVVVTNRYVMPDDHSDGT